ncbi:TonB-dependent receptor [Qingshengfaniella alkalisoli]|uniref:TonB-dependent receptor n=1 Tax=Qingshengfaniella alkalisoli TaxID=2599296 RepID=A0A5B8I894_9RHOB|nr:TonB-dependent receptor [Qingshengfaniella alkalisoli]
MIGLGGAPTFAQDADSYTPLGRIVLGAGVEKVAIDTPQAVTVIDQEELDEAQATTLADIFDEVPGVQAIGSDRAAGLSFNIRGIGDLGAADESKIIVNVDGTPKFYEQYRVGSFFSEPELYKQVEILRGPASSTLYGAGALGGVINFTTKDASDFLGVDDSNALRFRAGYDSNGNGGLGSVIWATRPSASTEFLAALNYRTIGSYEDGSGDEVPGSDFDAWSGLAKGTFWFGEDNEKALRLSYTRWQSNADDAEYSQTGTLSAFGTIDREIVDDTVVLSYEDPGLDNPWWDLDLALSYSNTRIKQDDASMPSFASPLWADTDYGYKTVALKADNTVEAYGDNWENFFTFGMQISHQDRIADADTGPIGFHPEGEDRRVGFYAQDEFTLNDRLTIIPGVRVDVVKLSPSDDVLNGKNVDDTAVSPKLAALYKFNDSFSVFGSVARTERIPTLDELYSTSAGDPQYPGGRYASVNLDKETSNNYELGFTYQKAGLLNDNDQFQFKTTGYWNELDNLISTNPARGQNVPVAYYVNIDEAEIKGVEVEAYYDMGAMFSRFAYNYTRGEDKATGETLTSIPADTLALTVGARNEERGLTYGWRGFFADSIEVSDVRYDAYNTQDLFVNWAPRDGALEGYEVAFAVENAFDATYQNNLSGDNGRGRNFKLTLSKQLNW